MLFQICAPAGPHPAKLLPGLFIQKPAHIYAKINEILSDKNFDAEMKSRFDALPIDTDVNKAVAMLMENCWE